MPACALAAQKNVVLHRSRPDERADQVRNDGMRRAIHMGGSEAPTETQRYRTPPTRIIPQPIIRIYIAQSQGWQATSRTSLAPAPQHLPK